MSWTEVLGFVTGAVSVVLYVRQKVWAWPIGIANSFFWLLLFWQASLYLDSGLQVVYLVLGVLGWYWWLHGGEPGEQLAVRRTRPREMAVLAAVGIVATAGLWWFDAEVAGSALPFWDASTTVVSLLAQYMLTRKLLGNWWLWILVDVAYVGMYTWRELYLTAALQPLFIVLCIAGLRSWTRSLAGDGAVATADAGSPAPEHGFVPLDPGDGLAWGEAPS